MSDTVTIDVTTLAGTDTDYAIAKDLASDILSGCYRDYLFFFSGSETVNSHQVRSVYVLLIGDNLERDNQNYYVMEDADFYEISVVCDTSSTSHDFDFSGNTFEADPSPVSHFSGDGSITSPESMYFTSYTYSSVDLVRVSSQVSCVFYSNLEHHPHIIKGVENYAFAAFCLVAVVFGFKLADRIMRRVY